MLDSAFANIGSFPKFQKRANLAHAVNDCGLPPQAEDGEIYQKACQTDRFVLTINFRHFKTLVKSNYPGVIAIPSELSNKEIDGILCKFISGKDPRDYYGEAIKLAK